MQMTPTGLNQIATQKNLFPLNVDIVAVTYLYLLLLRFEASIIVVFVAECNILKVLPKPYQNRETLT